MPDNQYLPRIEFPFLTLADVYLDGKSHDFPHDLAFTKSDGASQLYYTDASETLKSDINTSILFLVRLADAINSGSKDAILIWHTYSWRDNSLSNTGNMVIFDAKGNVLINDIAIDPYIYAKPSLYAVSD